MSVNVTTANGITTTHDEGTDLQANEDGTLVVFSPPKGGSGNKTRIAMYAPGHWSNAVVDQGPTQAEQIIEYLDDVRGDYLLKSAQGHRPPIEDWNAEIATAIEDLIGEIDVKIINPPKVHRSNPLDREAMEKLQAAEEAGKKAARTHVVDPPKTEHEPRA